MNIIRDGSGAGAGGSVPDSRKKYTLINENAGGASGYFSELKITSSTPYEFDYGEDSESNTALSGLAVHVVYYYEYSTGNWITATADFNPPVLKPGYNGKYGETEEESLTNSYGKEFMTKVHLSIVPENGFNSHGNPITTKSGYTSCKIYLVFFDSLSQSEKSLLIGEWKFWVRYPKPVSATLSPKRSFFYGEAISASDYTMTATLQDGNNTDATVAEMLYNGNPVSGSYTRGNDYSKISARGYVNVLQRDGSYAKEYVTSSDASLYFPTVLSCHVNGWKDGTEMEISDDPRKALKPDWTAQVDYSDGSSIVFAYKDYPSSFIFSGNVISSDGTVQPKSGTDSGEHEFTVKFTDPKTQTAYTVLFKLVARTYESYISSIALTQSGNSPEAVVDYGTTISVSDFGSMVLEITYSDGREGITTTDLSHIDIVSPTSPLKTHDDAAVAFSYRDTSARCYGTAHVKYLDSITVTESQREFYRGEKINLREIYNVFRHVRRSGSTEQTDTEVTSDVDFCIDNAKVEDPTAYVVSKSVTPTIVYSYLGEKKSQLCKNQLKMRDPKITGLSVSGKSDLSKNTYRENVSVGTYEGLVIHVTYEGGESEDVSYGGKTRYGYSLSYEPDTGYVLRSEDVGDARQCYVHGGDYEAGFTIKVLEDQVTGITLSTAKAKTAYRGGDRLNTDGIIASVTYASGNNTTGNTDDADSDSRFLFTPQSGYLFTEEDAKTGKKTITVTYGGKSASYDVAVTAPSVKSVTYSNIQKSLVSTVDTWNKMSGASARLVYDNEVNDEENFVYDGKNFTADWSDLGLDASDKAPSASLGTHKVRTAFVTRYGSNASDSFDVTVLADHEVVSIAIDMAKTTAESLVVTSGDVFTGKGIFVTLTYAQGQPLYESVELTNTSLFAANPAVGTRLYDVGHRNVTVSYIRGNVSIKSVGLDISVVPAYQSKDVLDAKLVVAKVPSINHNGDEILPYQYTDNDGTVHADEYVYGLYPANFVKNGELADKYKDRQDYAYGYVILGRDEGGVTTVAGKVILFDDYQPVTSGASNITVTFPHYVNEYSDEINGCTIGKIFGNANSNNRLFLSGTPSKKNRDWYSEDTGTTGDFSYFPDDNWKDYGQTDNDIVGYDIISTDQMIVLKSSSKVEPTNYFRSNGLRVAADASGNEKTDIRSGSYLYEESYPLLTGNIGVGALNPKGIVNFNGDTLFIGADKTVCGLDLSGQVGNSQRITSSRSRYIDNDLKEYTEDQLKESLLYTNGDYLFLALPDRMYVANRKMVASAERQYEWWRTDVKDVRSMASFDGKEYFGNSSGSFFVLENGSYSDCDKIFIGTGGTFVAHVDDASEIIYSEQMNEKLDASADYTFEVVHEAEDEKREDNIFYCLGRIGTDFIKPDNAEENADYRLRLDSPLLAERCAGLKAVYIGGRRFEVRLDNTLEDGSILRLTDIGGTAEWNNTLSSGELVLAMLQGEWKAGDFNVDKCSFSLFYPDGGKVNLEGNIIGASYTSELHKHTPVYAYYITAPFTGGSLSYRKTLWAWTLTDDTGLENQIEIGVATNMIDFDDMSRVALKTIYVDSIDSPVKGMSYVSYDFGSVDFRKAIVPEKYTYYRPVSVPLVCFAFRSSEPKNSILNALSLLYTIPEQGFGRN